MTQLVNNLFWKDSRVLSNYIFLSRSPASLLPCFFSASARKSPSFETARPGEQVTSRQRISGPRERWRGMRGEAGRMLGWGSDREGGGGEGRSGVRGGWGDEESGKGAVLGKGVE